MKAGSFLTAAAGIGLLAGFGGALAQAKKQDPASFDAGLSGVDKSVRWGAIAINHHVSLIQGESFKEGRNVPTINLVEK